MNRYEAIYKLQNKENLDEATQVALDSLLAWNDVISTLKDRIEFADKCHAKDYRAGIDAALYVVQQRLNDENIVS